MFKIEAYNYSNRYFSNINLKENALHITANLSLYNLIIENHVGDENICKVKSIDQLLEILYPRYNDLLNRNSLKIQLRKLLIKSDVKESFLKENNINLIFSDFMFLIESGIYEIGDFDGLSYEEKMIASIFNKFVKLNATIEIIDEMKSSKKFRYIYNLDGKIETIYLYNFNNLYLSRIVFFAKLRALGYDVVFRIPITNVSNVDKPWRSLYTDKFFEWSTRAVRGNKVDDVSFVEYLSNKKDKNNDIQFKEYAVTYDFKRDINKNKNRNISYYALDPSMVNQIFDIDENREYNTVIIRFIENIYSCDYRENDIYLSYDLMVELLTSGWIEISEGKRIINGVDYLDFLKNLQSYFWDVDSIEKAFLRIDELKDLKLASDTFEKGVKEKANKNKVKLFLSNPFRAISVLNTDDYEITINQLKLLIEELKSILKSILKQEDGFVNFNKNMQILKVKYRQNGFFRELKANPDYISIFTKVERILRYKVDFEYIHKFDARELVSILITNKKLNEQVLSIDNLDGNWQRDVFDEIHITDLSFKSYRKYLDSKKIMGKYINYSFVQRIADKFEEEQKNTLNMCIEIAKIYSKNIEMFLTFNIVSLLSEYKGKINLSYIKNLRTGDSESILLRLIRNIYKASFNEENSLLDYLDDVEVDKDINDENIEYSELIEKNKYVCPVGFLDLDFCRNKFIYSSILESHISYDSDFHQKLFFIQLISLLKGNIPYDNQNIEKFIFPLFPQWNETTKQNMMETSNYNIQLKDYNLYENINYPKAISKIETLMSKYNEKYRIRNRYKENRLDTEAEFKAFLKDYLSSEDLYNSGKHCSMCPYILFCKEGEYQIEKNR